jgi:hypothetical protein
MLARISPNPTDYIIASMIEDAQAEARRRGYFILTGSVSTKPGVPSTGQKATTFLGRTR